MKKNNIKSLTLKQGSKIIRNVSINHDKREVIDKDSLKQTHFYYNNEGKLIALERVNNKSEKRKFDLNFKENPLSGLTQTIETDNSTTVNQRSYVVFDNIQYKETKRFGIDKITNDTFAVSGVRYFFKAQNPNLSYKEVRDNDNWYRYYFNETKTSKTRYKNSTVLDSIVNSNLREDRYRIENYDNKDQIITVKTDSLYTTFKKEGKLNHYKSEHNYLIHNEIFYDENEFPLKRIHNIYYKNEIGETVLWEVQTQYQKEKLKKTYPNKKEYKLKKGVLYYRNNTNVHRVLGCGTSYKDKVRYIPYFYIESFSPSILFNLKVEKSIADNFDSSVIEDYEDDMIYTDVIVKNTSVPEVSNNMGSEDLNSELLRTLKSATSSRWLLKRFDNMEVEAQTNDGKVFRVKIDKAELLNFPLSIVVFQAEY